MPGAWTRHLLPAGPWQHPRGAMHGLANGEIRKNAKDMDVYQAFEGPDSVYPDGLITDEALKQMDTLAKADKPFFLAVGIIRPHLPFGTPAQYMKPYANATLPATPHPTRPEGKTTWHGSGEFMKYNRWKRNPNTDAEFALEVRKHYAGCVTYADALVGRLLERLDNLKLRDNTIIVLWGDHGWHLGEHAIWGKHALFEESLHSPLIISAPGMAAAGDPTQAVVETLDIFPTICELTGLKPPSGLNGQSLMPILTDPSRRVIRHLLIAAARRLFVRIPIDSSPIVAASWNCTITPRRPVKPRIWPRLNPNKPRHCSSNCALGCLNNYHEKTHTPLNYRIGPDGRGRGRSNTEAAEHPLHHC